MGAAASSSRTLPPEIDRETALELVRTTPGLQWDESKWTRVAVRDRARREDIERLLDELRLDDGDEEAKAEGLHLLPEDDDSLDGPGAYDAPPLEESLNCPGTFDEDVDDGTPTLEYPDDDTFAIVGKGATPSPKRASGKKRRAREVEGEIFAADGEAFVGVDEDAPGAFDEDADDGGPTTGKTTAPDLSLTGKALAVEPSPKKKPPT